MPVIFHNAVTGEINKLRISRRKGRREGGRVGRKKEGRKEWIEGIEGGGSESVKDGGKVTGREVERNA